MCREVKQDTKQKIALALRQLLQERPLRKITVQDLMERTQMTRQSFYYHFQDIQDVLTWIGEQEFAALREDTELSFEDWLMQVLVRLDADRSFYRQVLNFASHGFLFQFCDELLRPRIMELLFGAAEEQQLDARQHFVVDFYIHAVLAYLPMVLVPRHALDADEARARLHCLLETLNLNGAGQPLHLCCGNAGTPA